MAFSLLQRGDFGEEVRTLQQWLNRVGAMLDCDGDYGPGTERGVRYAQDAASLPTTGKAEPELWSWLETQHDPFPLLDTDGIAFIAREETGGLAYYDARTQWPHYPGLSSGITIGIGYDLRFNTETDFRKLWGTCLSPSTVDTLCADIGKAGTKGRAAELKKKNIIIPFKSAWQVFIRKTLPRYYNDTRAIYPSLETLPLPCRSALVSIVFNRGNSLECSERTEMRAIRDILSDATDPSLSLQERKVILAEVEDKIISMKRLWGPETGLYKRRQGEADIWRKGVNTLS